MATNRKPHPSAKLKNLSAARKETLWLWLTEGEGDAPPLGYAEAVARVSEEWNVKTSVTAMGEFYSWYGVRVKVETARLRSEQVREELARDGRLDPEALDTVAEAMFLADAMDRGDFKQYILIAKLLERKRARKLDGRRVTVMERKLEELRKAAEDPDATDAEKAAKMREIFNL